MDRPVLNSMLLGSTDPHRLKTWYRDGFHAETDGYGNLNLGGFGLVIEKRDDVAGRTAEPGRVVINFARRPRICARSTWSGWSSPRIGASVGSRR